MKNESEFQLINKETFSVVSLISVHLCCQASGEKSLSNERSTQFLSRIRLTVVMENRRSVMSTGYVPYAIGKSNKFGKLLSVTVSECIHATTWGGIDAHVGCVFLGIRINLRVLHDISPEIMKGLISIEMQNGYTMKRNID